MDGAMRVPLSAAGAVGLTTALPVDEKAEPAHHADPMPELFMQLMKDVISPGSGSSGGSDGGAAVMKDVMGMVGSLAQAGGNGGSKGGLMDDPMVKMMTSLAQTAMAQPAGDAKDGDMDPMMKMGMAGMKAFMQTMGGEDASPAADLEEGDHHAPAHEDPLAPLMNLMMKGMQALASDKKGDPVGAVMNVVLDDPVMSANPVIKAVKAAINDKTGDPLNAMIDSLMAQPEMQKDPYVLPILRIAKNVVSNMPKEGDTADPLAAILNALAGPPKSPRAPKALVSPDVAGQ